MFQVSRLSNLKKVVTNNVNRMCGLCHEEGTYDDEESPPAPEDIFQQLETKLDELRYKYGRLVRRFERKKKQAPKMCVICFEDFQPETDVI